MSFAALPPSAAWRHHEARIGFEVAYFEAVDDGVRVKGSTTAIEDECVWDVDYAIALDAAWRTRRARVTRRVAGGVRVTTLDADGAGGWLVDGEAAPQLDGCLDVDLESSAMTNAFPVHRMVLPIGVRAEAPAAYVRVADLSVERLEQAYARLPYVASRHRYDYSCPRFGVSCQLLYDPAGLVLDYPRLAVRVG